MIIDCWIQVSSATGRLLRKYHIWRTKAKTFSWTMIQPFLYEGKVLPGDVREVRSFWKVLANEAIGVLIETAFPRVVRMSEVERRTQGVSDLLVQREFLAVVRGQGVDEMTIGPKGAHDLVGYQMGFSGADSLSRTTLLVRTLLNGVVDFMPVIAPFRIMITEYILQE